ncbi:GNAT family N-acetyltransferase [Luteipulveratus mongoliensis]|uniref:Lysine N-acyltransferase MbtK n=1 Tax=Luteipulveratus mongoliensis TaxID=571913 RepID=A0A0K1JFC2_9MICO|nr:GNAT family N-acetyltransferase [Luteipulveratus mongoliensis]AKU15409.1 hypothetical protein VV02_05230 [Luteipulveratus mongoliensis]
MTTPPAITMRPVDPEQDAATIHSWTSQERAAFWGMLERPVDEVRDIYAYIDEQPHLAAYLVHADDEPLALFQTYDPQVDEIGQFYDRRPGDVGIHLLIGPGHRPSGATAAMTAFLAGWVWSDPAHQRIVFEPDVRNDKSVAFLGRVGAELGPEVQLAEKVAQFGFLTRDAWFARQKPRAARA